MSNNVFSCAKQLFLTLADVQSQPERLEQTETLYMVAKDKSKLQVQLDRASADGIAPLVSIKTMPIACQEATDGTFATDCETTGAIKVPTTTYRQFEIDEAIKTNLYSISESDYRSACAGTYSDAFLTAFNLCMSELRSALNTKAKAFLTANATEDLGTIVLVNADGSSVMPSTFKIKQAFRKKGLTGIPNVVGGEVIDLLQNVYSKTNSETGISGNMRGGLNMYYESSIVGTEAFAVMPNSVQLVTYCQYGDASQYGHTLKAGSASEIMANFMSWQTLGDLLGRGCVPVGINSIDGGVSQAIWADYKIITKCDKIYIQMSINYKFINVHTQLCNSNFNGILRFDTCPIPELTCPTPIPVVPTPYVAKEFLWDTAPCDVNAVIYNMTLCGVTYTGAPMTWDGTLPTLAFIINALHGGAPIVEVVGTDIVTKAPFTGTGMCSTGGFNNDTNTFLFV